MSVCLVFVSSPPHLPVSGDPGFSPFPSLRPWSPLLSPRSAPTSWNPLSPHNSPCLASLTSLHPKAPALFHLPAPREPWLFPLPCPGAPTFFPSPCSREPRSSHFLEPGTLRLWKRTWPSPTPPCLTLRGPGSRGRRDTRAKSAGPSSAISPAKLPLPQGLPGPEVSVGAGTDCGGRRCGRRGQVPGRPDSATCFVLLSSTRECCPPGNGLRTSQPLNC